MYKILKFKYENRHDHFWSSDFHNYHDPNWDVPIWKQRGYNSVEESYNDVRDKINSRVSEYQHLWTLGDSHLSCSDEQVIAWWSSINCQNIHYLFGNHSSQMYRIYKQEVLKQYGSDEIEVYPLRMGNVIFSGNHQEILIGKQKIVMNHFPLHSWNAMGRKSLMLSGHQHCTDKTRTPDCPINRVLDVGWDWKNDVWSYDEIMDVMSTKMFLSVDHHDTNTN